MIEKLTADVIYKYSYYQVFLLVLGYFVLLYFGLAPLFNAVCRLLARRKLLHRITDKPVSAQQIRSEIGHSLVSVFIFGLSGIPVVYLIRNGVIRTATDTVIHVIVAVVILTIWNELHFFLVHRIMHLPYFMKRVHYIHHRSVIPTVYSVYSFHWFEALLLSTVPLTIAPFVALPAKSFIIYPLTSVLLNYAGHCNYRFGQGGGSAWTLFGTNHNDHHSKFKKNYGFATDLLDRIYFKLTSHKSNADSK